MTSDIRNTPYFYTFYSFKEKRNSLLNMSIISDFFYNFVPKLNGNEAI